MGVTSAGYSCRVTNPPSRSTLSARVREAAERWFGHRELLPGQEEAVQALLDGRDVLLVAPTGAGKSLAYQLAGMLLDGCTVSDEQYRAVTGLPSAQVARPVAAPAS